MNAPMLNPTSCPRGVDPREWRKALSSRIKQHLAVVSGLLALLDTFDGDPDLEDGADDEPSLGGLSIYNPDARGGFELDLEHDKADDEPALAWCPAHEWQSQAMIATEHTFDPDREQEHDGREPEPLELSEGYDAAEGHEVPTGGGYHL
jgi:hypothetical protein